MGFHVVYISAINSYITIINRLLCAIYKTSLGYPVSSPIESKGVSAARSSF